MRRLIKRAYLSIFRQPGKSSVLFSVTFILSLVFISALAIWQVINITEAQLIQRIPAVAILEFDIEQAVAAGVYDPHNPVPDPHLTIEILTEIGDLPAVYVYDFIFDVTLWSRSYSWPHVFLDESKMSQDVLGTANWTILSPRTRGAEIESFHGRGVINPQLTDVASGLISLISGRTFTQEEIDENAHVAVISEDFAHSNQLSVGSMLEFENIAYDYEQLGQTGTGVFERYRHLEEVILAYERLEVEVIGIFEIMPTVDDEDLRDWELLSILDAKLHLSNRIYMPIGVVEDRQNFIINEMTEEQRRNGTISDHIFRNSIFVLNSPRAYTDFSEAAELILPDFWYVRDMSHEFAPLLSAMDHMHLIAIGVKWAVGITIVLILGLMLTLFLRERQYEIGVYMALGERKRAVVGQIFMEIGLITGLSIVLAFFASGLITNTISSYMLEQQLQQQFEISEQNIAQPIPWELTLLNPSHIGVDEMLAMNHVTLPVDILVVNLGITFCVILIATLLPVSYILKLSPKKALIKMQ